MDYIAALKTVLTLAGFALLYALMAEFPNATSIIVCVILGGMLFFLIVTIIYLRFKGDLPEI